MDIDALKEMFSMHIKECDARDERNNKAFDEMKTMSKGIWDTIDKNRITDASERKELRASITNLQIRAAMFLGGLIVVGKLLDYIWVHK